MMHAIWARSARVELAEIIEHIATDNPSAAINLDYEIMQTVERLEQFPYSGRIGRVCGTREAIIGNYILVYKISDGAINIVRIFHGARKYPFGKRIS